LSSKTFDFLTSAHSKLALESCHTFDHLQITDFSTGVRRRTSSFVLWGTSHHQPLDPKKCLHNLVAIFATVFNGTGTSCCILYDLQCSPKRGIFYYNPLLDNSLCHISATVYLILYLCAKSALWNDDNCVCFKTYKQWQLIKTNFFCLFIRLYTHLPPPSEKTSL